MSIRGIGDGYAFQRLLWLLVGTVVVPTLLLSLFGVMAIRNQRAAMMQQLDRVQQLKLAEGAGGLLETIHAVEERARTAAASCELPCPTPDGVSTWWVWTNETTPEEVAKLGLVLEVNSEQTVWATPDDSGPVGRMLVGDRNVVFRIDPNALEETLVRSMALPDSAVLQLVAPSPTTASTFDEMLEEWQRPSRTELVLGSPLAGWRLTMMDPEDPSLAVLRRNGWLYPVSLVLLVGLVLIGTVVTLSSASREIRLSRLQTDFVSNVSHELRTPLTSIRMFVETLQSGRLQDPEKVAECLGLLSDETERLSRRIERVLDWARMEAGRRVYDREPVSPTTLVDEAMAALRSQRLLVANEVVVDVPEGLPEIEVDRDAIVEALLNLLQNAVKYTPAPKEITLTIRQKPKWLGLAVSDNGPGIAPEHRKRIFEKFYQADNFLSAPTQGGANHGSGLGLSIVRAVSKAHGGKVDLDTEVGGGSRFTLWIPA